jgi:hypothetical protein
VVKLPFYKAWPFIHLSVNHFWLISNY